MEKTTEKKSGLAAIFRLCPVRHIIALVSAVLIIVHLLLRGNHQVMVQISQSFVRPVLAGLARFTGLFPFSVAELMIALLVIGLLVFIPLSILRIVKGENRLKQLYKFIISLVTLALAVYAGFCTLWGSYFYGDDFTESSGLEAEAISTQELAVVTEYFAALSNQYASQVPRDENGVCATDRQQVLDKSGEVFTAAQELFPCLQGPDVPVKGIVASPILSYLDFTGFFFPFTGEANVNMDFPPSLFASTVAHELSHQRGVAKEQEANFVAVMACLSYGDVDYCYSASLLAYIHLGNALYSADNQAWQRIYASLSPQVLADFSANNQYWAKFETAVQTVSNTVYENFLYSFDQELGLKSYGACVDLLVNYYYEDALLWLNQ